MNWEVLKANGDGRVAKICLLPELVEIAEEQRRRGRRVVLCHGTFDQLHLGHVRHFEAARRFGDALLVTVTADPFVGKGPGRPYFTQQIRAEMIAAISCVDWVGISEEPSAITMIEAIKPQFYVKGSDYRDAADDVTGKIDHERVAAERHGGALVFTDEVTFSSSALLNRYSDMFSEEVRSYLDEIRGPDSFPRLQRLIESAREMDVVLVGETIIDDYAYVDTLGKSAKENIIATLLRSNEEFAGGVIAAANHLATICRSVTVVTCHDETHPAAEIVRRQLRPEIQLSLVNVPGLAPTVKRRFIDQSYMRKMFEVYEMDDSPLSVEAEANLQNRLAQLLPGADVVIVTDFGHGMIGENVVRTLVDGARFLAVNTQVNSGNRGFNLIDKYPKADFVCIDEPELRLVCRDKFAEIPRLMRRRLIEMIECPNVIVTQGRNGCFAFRRGAEPHHVPAFTRAVVDTLGAGDAFLAVCSPLVAAGGDIADIALIGNAAGALKVNIHGHRKPIDRDELLNYIKTLLK